MFAGIVQTYCLAPATIAGRLCLISADAIIILMTWYTAIRMGVLRRGPYWSRPSFWQIMFRDGM